MAIPLNRVTPLKKEWKNICQTAVHDLRLDIRFNVGQRCVELRTNSKTPQGDNIEKAVQYISSFAKGFDLKDCAAFLRIDNLMVDTFDI